MPLITVSSDLGGNNFSDSYVIERIQQKFPSYRVVSLFHQEDIYDLESIAYQIRGALNLFPPDTIHLIFCKYSLSNYHLILSKINFQYVIGSDNGVSSLLHDYELDPEYYKYIGQLSEFNLEKYIDSYCEVIDSILKKNYSQVLDPNPTIVQTKPFNTGLIIQPDRIITRVVSISSTGSLILNLTKKQFYDTVQDQSFYIQFVTIKISKISPNYTASETNNKMGAIFNEAGFLEIFMIGGHVAKLFNINKYSNNKIEIIIGDDSNRQIKFLKKIIVKIL